MSSFLAKIFGWGGRSATKAARRPAPASRPASPVGPQRRGDFTYSDTSTWTFPHQSVVSSNVASVAYDFEEQVLEIRFHEASRNHTSTYRYSEVPLSVYRGLMSAPSKGRFVWAYIRDRYTYADI